MIQSLTPYPIKQSHKTMILVHSKLLNYHTQENSDHKHILQITNIKYKRDIRFDWCGVIEKWSDKEVKGSTSHPHAQHYILSFVVPKKKVLSIICCN
jgi:hypothetical protein